MSEKKDPRRLHVFQRNDVKTIAASIKPHLSDKGRIFFQPFDDKAVAVLNLLDSSVKSKSIEVLPLNTKPEKPASKIEEQPLDLYVFLSEGETLQRDLLHCVSLQKGQVFIQKTDEYYQNRPLFIISPPKAGTHLLLNLVQRMGFRDGYEPEIPMKGGHWYFVEYSNPHTVAKDFFVDSVRRAQFGNRHHQFRRSPALIMFRNPLAVLNSEAHFYHQDGKTAFCGYLRQLSKKERFLRLVNDPWLLGSIRDRVGCFSPWLDCENVLPVSFEELTGKQGGGDDSLQLDAVWSLLLRLQVPGCPEEITSGLFNVGSHTFRKGHISDFLIHMDKQVIDQFRSLPQDFMERLGYDLERSLSGDCFSTKIEEFKSKIATTSSASFDDEPIVLESDFLGCHLVSYRKKYYAVNSSLPVRGNFSQLGETVSSITPSSDNLASLKRTVVRLLAGGAVVSPPIPSVVESTEHYVIMQAGNQYIAVNKEIWPVDLFHERLGEREIQNSIVVGNELDQVRNRAEAMVFEGKRPEIRLVSENKKYNFLFSEDKFIAVDKSLGPIDLFLEKIGEREISPKILISDDLNELMERAERIGR